MKQKTSRRIIDYIKTSGQARAKELTDHLRSIGARAVRKQLKKLIEEGVLQKIGRPPKVFYLLASRPSSDTSNHTIDKRVQTIINDRYLYISPAGEELPGWEGFMAWCRKTKQDPIRLSTVYVATLKKYDAFRMRGLIDGIPKLRRTFPTVYLDRIFYLDFYSIEQFGKTKLEDRIENAGRTIVVEDTGAYKNVLLIDDAVGSGATLNETAKQIRTKGLCRGNIIGLAIEV